VVTSFLGLPVVRVSPVSAYPEWICFSAARRAPPHSFTLFQPSHYSRVSSRLRPGGSPSAPSLVGAPKSPHSHPQMVKRLLPCPDSPPRGSAFFPRRPLFWSPPGKKKRAPVWKKSPGLGIPVPCRRRPLGTRLSLFCGRQDRPPGFSERNFFLFSRPGRGPPPPPAAWSVSGVRLRDPVQAPSFLWWRLFVSQPLCLSLFSNASWWRLADSIGVCVSSRPRPPVESFAEFSFRFFFSVQSTLSAG